MEPQSRSLAWLLLALGGLTALTTIGIALSPVLLVHHPMVLLALSPVDRHMLLASSVVGVVPFVVL
jgi:hypothetical protein